MSMRATGNQASPVWLTVRFWFTWLDRSTSLQAAFFRLATLRYAARRAARSRPRRGSGFFEDSEDPEFIAGNRENANDFESNPRDQLAQHDRRRPVHARGVQRKVQADPCAQGLAGEPVAISKTSSMLGLSSKPRRLRRLEAGFHTLTIFC